MQEFTKQQKLVYQEIKTLAKSERSLPILTPSIKGVLESLIYEDGEYRRNHEYMKNFYYDIPGFILFSKAKIRPKILSLLYCEGVILHQVDNKK